MLLCSAAAAAPGSLFASGGSNLGQKTELPTDSHTRQAGEAGQHGGGHVCSSLVQLWPSGGGRCAACSVEADQICHLSRGNVSSRVYPQSLNRTAIQPSGGPPSSALFECFCSRRHSQSFHSPHQFSLFSHLTRRLPRCSEPGGSDNRGRARFAPV